MSLHLRHERYVVWAALDNTADWRTATRLLSSRDFEDGTLRRIFAVLATLEPTGPRHDEATVFAALKKAGGETLADAAEEVAHDSLGSSVNLHIWIRTVSEASITRRISTSLKLAVTALESGAERDAVEHTLENQLAAIRASAPDNRVFDDKALMAAQAMAYLDDDTRAGTPYGFAPWDAMVLPAQPSHLVLLGGASGAGKSAVARNLLRSMVQRYKRTVGWLTCEMSGEEQLVHLACMDANVPLEDYYRRTLTKYQRERFAAELAAWQETPLLRVNEMGTVTPATALSIFRRWREQGVDHFVLDHLHRLDYGANKSGDDLRVPVAAFARALKNFAKDSEATVYALVQYSKIKPHEEPSDDKIREANNVLEEADAVFHIYRPHIACERDLLGTLVPLTKQGGGRYFAGVDAPEGSILAPDRETVYVKLGKQRRRLTDGMVRVPFNHRLALMYDTPREETQAPLRIA